MALARIGCYSEHIPANTFDKIRNFENAAWIFKQVHYEKCLLRVEEYSPDFQDDTLSCMAYLMLAQAQYLYYNLAADENKLD